MSGVIRVVWPLEESRHENGRALSEAGKVIARPLLRQAFVTEKVVVLIATLTAYENGTPVTSGQGLGEGIIRKGVGSLPTLAIAVGIFVSRTLP